VLLVAGLIAALTALANAFNPLGWRIEVTSSENTEQAELNDAGGPKFRPSMGTPRFPLQLAHAV